jgi:hypothetical protein
MNLRQARDSHNAARDRRQAMKAVGNPFLHSIARKLMQETTASHIAYIDTDSDLGSWAEALRYVQFPVVEYDTWWETRHERRAARRQSVAVLAAKKGHSTRWQRAGAQARSMFQ